MMDNTCVASPIEKIVARSMIGKGHGNTPERLKGAEDGGEEGWRRG